jgi:fimbrial chaperone protein
VLANPPIFTVPPGGSQLIRAGLRRPPDARRELTYRIFLQELPPPPNPDFSGAKMLMRVSLPVFVVPALAAEPVLRWKAAHTSDGALKISLTNIGNAHVQISNFSLSLPGSRPLHTFYSDRAATGSCRPTQKTLLCRRAPSYNFWLRQMPVRWRLKS